MTIIHYTRGSKPKCGTCKDFKKEKSFYIHANCSNTKNKIKRGK